MQNDMLYIGIFMLVSLFIPGIAITIAGILGPKKPAPIKNSFTNAVSKLSARPGSNLRRSIIFMR